MNLEHRARHTEFVGMAALLVSGASFLLCFWVSPIALSFGIVAIERGAPCLSVIPKRDPLARYTARDAIRRNAVIGVTYGALAIVISLLSAATMLFGEVDQ